MNLVIDFGNTNIKCGFFRSGHLESVHLFKDINSLSIFMDKHTYTKIGVCTVTHDVDYLKKHVPGLAQATFLTHTTKIPLQIDYDTPDTLGMDRLAAAIGAFALFSDRPLMVIDVGTCITYDFVNEQGIYRGGIISPGIALRYRAMHDYTKKLPLLDTTETDVLIGKSTHNGMASGVINGIRGEMEFYIAQFTLKNPNLKVVMTGGSARLFESKIKSDIFVAPEIVLVGLNRVLEYNAA